MAFFTEMGKTYRVTGSGIDAWLDYTPPGSDEHDPGQSNTSAGFSLSGCLITVVEQCHRVEEGYPKSGPQNAPYEVVKVTVEDHPGELYAWVVYEGVVKVEEYTTPVQPPEPKPEPEQPEPEPEPQLPEVPDGQPGDVQIEVHAGQTVVVEVRSTTNVLEGGSSPPGAEENRAKLKDLIATARANIKDLRLTLQSRPNQSIQDEVDLQEADLEKIAGTALATNRTKAQQDYAVQLKAIIASLLRLQAKLR
jgi:hypothetical protein